MLRRIIFSALLTLTWVPLFAQSGLNASDEEAIKAVALKETKSFYDRDLDGLLSVWLQDARTARTFFQGPEAYSQMGWESIEQTFRSGLECCPEPIPVEIRNENYVITMDGRMAWMEYDQTLSDPGGNQAGKRTSREMRALVKENGEWKIFRQVTYDTFADRDEATEAALNGLGYGLLEAARMYEAIEVFKLNVKLFPDSWNVYDSLGEAYMAVSNNELAIQNYEKSLELNPENTYGKEMLTKLRQE